MHNDVLIISGKRGFLILICSDNKEIRICVNPTKKGSNEQLRSDNESSERRVV